MTLDIAKLRAETLALIAQEGCGWCVDGLQADGETPCPCRLGATFPAAETLRLLDEIERLRTALADLVSWFDSGPISQGVWLIRAGEQGADDAVEAARAALAEGGPDDR